MKRTVYMYKCPHCSGLGRDLDLMHMQCALCFGWCFVLSENELMLQPYPGNIQYPHPELEGGLPYPLEYQELGLLSRVEVNRYMKQEVESGRIKVHPITHTITKLPKL